MYTILPSSALVLVQDHPLHSLEEFILKELYKISQKTGVERLAILECNYDLFRLMSLHESVQGFQVIIKIFSTLPRSAADAVDGVILDSHPFQWTLQHPLQSLALVE